jgi:anti-sigma B factor antagonist
VFEIRFRPPQVGNSNAIVVDWQACGNFRKEDGMQSHAETNLNGYGPFLVPGPQCSVVDREVSGVSVIDLTGPLVRELSVLAFLEQIRELLDQGARSFAINLADVPYADSYGVGGLATAHNLVQNSGGRIKFFAARDRLLRTFHRLRLDTVLDLLEDERSALSSFH